MFYSFIQFELDKGGVVKGSATDVGHEEWSRIEEWSHGFTNTGMVSDGAGYSMSQGKADHQDFSFSKYADAASMTLLKSCWNGDLFKEVTIECLTQATGVTEPDLIITLEKAKITSLSVSPGIDELATESYSIAYEQVTYNNKRYAAGDTRGQNDPVKCDRTKNELT